MASHLAKQLLAIKEHDPGLERFDLANFTQPQVHELVKDALVHEYPVPLRFQFVVGGGKLVRQKYHEDLQKWFAAALREAGFDEDRGAALGSVNAWKRQEDLGQNLVYIYVFPKVAAKAAAGAATGESTAAPVAAAPAGPTPAQRVATCSLDEFKRMVPSRIVTWSEKRRATEVLRDALARIDALEAKMAGRAQLSEAELAEYSSLARDVLEEKTKWLAGEMKAQVGSGLLTAWDLQVILAEMGDKLKEIKAKAGASSAAAAKAAELEEKRAALEKARPVLPPVRGEADIRKVRAALAALDRLEKAKAGKLMTVTEAQQLGQRPELEARLQQLLDDARGWFEDAAHFDERVKQLLKAPTGPAGGRR